MLFFFLEQSGGASHGGSDIKGGYCLVSIDIPEFIIHGYSPHTPLPFSSIDISLLNLNRHSPLYPQQA